MSSPLLSICIPTFNRAALLELMLASLYRQISHLKGRVEMVVSDNASSDNTWQIVLAYKDKPYVRIVKLEDPSTVLGNFASVIEAASGEYVWIVGDDDWILPGGVNHVVAAIAGNPKIDYVFANYFCDTIERRDHLIRQELDGQDLGNFHPPRKKYARFSVADRLVPKWEQLWNLPGGGHRLWLHTSIVGHILRRSIWVANMHWLKAITAKDSPSPPRFYPHLVIVAKWMVGKPCYYLGSPCVLMGQGSQGWVEINPILHLQCMPQVIAFYESLGLDKRLTRSFKSEQLLGGGNSFLQLWHNAKIREQYTFSMAQYVKEHGLNPRFWLGLLRVPLGRCKRMVLAYVRHVWPV